MRTTAHCFADRARENITALHRSFDRVEPSWKVSSRALQQRHANMAHPGAHLELPVDVRLAKAVQAVSDSAVGQNILLSASADLTARVQRDHLETVVKDRRA